MAKKADLDILAELHESLAQLFIEKLASGECKAADLNVIRQFLKDNCIQADPESSTMQQIVDQIPSTIKISDFD